MTRKSEPNMRPFKRILVALDASSQSEGALQYGVFLANQMQAQLTGIFVEDINLLRLSQLPFASEIRFAIRQTTRLDEVNMAQQLQLQAIRVRETVHRASKQHNLDWTFQVARGQVAAELLQAAAAADLLILGQTSRQLIASAHIGKTAQTAVSQEPGSVLITHSRANPDQPILLIYDGSAAADEALLLSFTLAKRNGRLHILALSPDDETTYSFKNQILQQADDRRLALTMHTYHSPEKLTGLIRQFNIGLVIISSRTTLPEATLQTLLTAPDFAVLILKPA